MSANVGVSILLSPILRQLLKNWTSLGAIVSCSAHLARENHSGRTLELGYLSSSLAVRNNMDQGVEVRVAYSCVFRPPIQSRWPRIGLLCFTCRYSRCQPTSVLLSPIAVLEDLVIATPLANFVSLLSIHLRGLDHSNIVHFLRNPSMR